MENLEKTVETEHDGRIENSSSRYQVQDEDSLKNLIYNRVKGILNDLKNIYFGSE